MSHKKNQTIVKTMGNYICRGNFYRVIRSQLKLDEKERGLNLLNVELKFMALLIKTQFTSLNSEKVDYRIILQVIFVGLEKKILGSRIFKRISEIIEAIEKHLKSRLKNKQYIPVIFEVL